MSTEKHGGLSDTSGNKPRRSWMGIISKFLDESGAKADKIIQTQQYASIRQHALQQGGLSTREAWQAMDQERIHDVESFVGKAVDLFAYRTRITTGDGAISDKAFASALYNTPQAVLDDSQVWADIFARREAATADWAHTVEIPDSYLNR